jgi:hypothetical protein
MEIRTYFRKESAKERAKKVGVTEFKTHTTTLLVDDSYPELLYFKTNSLHVPLPKFLKGLKAVFITLQETLHTEQNPHIKQGRGKRGDTKYEVSYGTKEYRVNSPNQYAEAFYPVIRIHLVGDKLQSISDCYQAIRQGNSEGDWKGMAIAPEHCKVNSYPFMDMEQM